MTGWRRLIGLAVAAVAVGMISGCGPSEASQGAARPKGYPYQVTTTTGMITDIVREVAGEHAEVEGIIGEGIDPHLYQATTADVKSLRAAEVIFYNGLMLEGKMGDVLVKVARGGKPVHAVTESLEAGDGYLMTTAEEHLDPHVWMDVAGWMRAVHVVQKALAEFDPDHAADYEAHATTYLVKLRALDDYARRSMATIPKRQRVLVTACGATPDIGKQERVLGY